MLIKNLNTTLIWAAAILFAGAISWASCSKIDTLPQLELTVVNSSGQAIQGVPVGLFDEIDEWSMLENPVQAWRATDANGKVLFIDLKEEIYFFYADGDTLSNIGNEIQLKEPLSLNERRQVKLIIE